MGAWVDVHTIQTGTGTSAIVKSGLSGTPKFLIFLGVKRNLAGTVADLRLGFGCATGAAERWAQTTWCGSGVAPSNVARELRNDCCFVLLDSETTEVGRLDLTSLDAAGYTLAVDVAFTADTTVLVMAVGGSDFTNAKAFIFPCATAVGNYSITTPGFRPTWNLFGGLIVTSNINVIANAGSFNLGIGVSSTMRWAAALAARDNVATTNTSGIVNTDRCFSQIDPSSGAGLVLNAHDFVSQDATGFTLNRLDSTDARSVGCLSVQGGQVFAGTTTMRTDTNNEVVTAPGFPVLGLLFAAHPEATASEGTTVSGSAELTLGMASSPTQRGSVWVGDQDALTTSDADSELSTTRLALNRTVGTVADQGEMDLASLDAAGFTLDQITAGAVALLLPYLAIGASPAGPRVLSQAVPRAALW